MNTKNLNNRLIWLIAIVTIYAAIISTVNLTKDARIGYVNSNLLLEGYNGAVEAREKLQAETSKWQENIKTLETELTALNKEIIEQNDKWNKKTRNEKKEQFEKKQEDYARYKQAVTEKAVKMEQELMQTVFAELNAKMEDFGKATGHEMIFGTVSGGNILYAQKATDLTDAFLAYVNDKS